MASNDERPERLLLSPTEAAERLGVSLGTVGRLRRIGALPTVRIGHSPRIKLSDLTAYVESLTENPSEIHDPNAKTAA
jgi:excisionase family DNA binding protein